MMSSLVLELQKAAMNKDERVLDVLRKALVVSSKLGLEDLKEWCEAEMNGYKKQPVPQYRVVQGELKAFNPFNGIWIPVMCEDAKSQEMLNERGIGQPIGELEDICSLPKNGVLDVPLPHEWVIRLFGKSELFRAGVVPTLVIGRNKLIGIIETVRTKILQWSLELEKNGIIGEGLTFSNEEVKKASNATYNIGIFKGVIGNVSNAQIQIGDYNSIHAELKRRGVSQSERNELEAILDELSTSSGQQKEGLIKRGIDWVTRNGNTLGTFSETIRKWFEHFSG